ncbi:MAG: cysteine desulfurase family protein [Kineosporiaceae bacterium]
MSVPAPAYLDHAASTPVRPQVAAAVARELVEVGNPSSLHGSGRAARRVVEESREQLAASLGCRPSEVVFTAGGTEADNLAVKGLFWARRAADARRRRLVVGATEHHAVLDPVEWLVREQDAEVTWVPVDAHGRVRLEALREALAESDDVALVSLMWANNEVGTLQPVEQIAHACREAGVPWHCDAVQALGQVPVDVSACGADVLAVSGHKVGAPVSTGALVVRRGVALQPVLHGGGQERNLRSGTLDAVGARALATAVELAVAAQPEESRRLAGLRDDLVAAVLRAVPDAVLRGDPDPSGRLPGNAHLTFPGCEGDSLLYLLDARGVEASTGSACQAGVPRASHVLLAMGVDEASARGALRFSLGWSSTAADVEALAAAIGPVVERARRAGLVAS